METTNTRKATISYEPKINSEHPFRVTIFEKDSELLGLSLNKIIETEFFQTEKEALSFAKKNKVIQIRRADNLKNAKKDKGGAK